MEELDEKLAVAEREIANGDKGVDFLPFANELREKVVGNEEYAIDAEVCHVGEDIVKKHLRAFKKLAK